MKDYHDLVQQQRRFFKTGATKDYQFRKNALLKLKVALKQYESAISLALQQDLGKSEVESYFSEVGLVLREIDFHLRHLHYWMKAKRAKTPLFLKPSTSKILPEPYGVTLIISPWNYPLQLAIMPLIGAISAGNTAIIKVSELAPQTAKVISQMMRATFRPEYLAVVQGDATVATALLKEQYDLIFFTGSTRVGKIIAQAAANHLTPTLLELGGKSPVIFNDTVNLRLAVKRIALGKLLNSGQTCVAPDYLLLPTYLKPAFVHAFREVMYEFYGYSGINDVASFKDLPKIIDQQHFKRLELLLAGQDLLWGGNLYPSELKIQPTLVDSGALKQYINYPTSRPAILTEEIFGPILPVLTYDNLEEVIAYLHHQPKPLALYLYTEQKHLRKKLLRELSFGGGCVNDCLLHLGNDYLPFGGVGASGQGHYHGKASFLAFSHQKSLLFTPMWFDLPLKYPPFTDRQLKFVKKFLK